MSAHQIPILSSGKDFAGSSSNKCLKSFLILLWLSVAIQILTSNLKSQTQHDSIAQRRSLPEDRLFGVLFAEAGKKKKEKSEVVVISVNSQGKGGHYGGYPMYIPTCGGHGGGGGYGGSFGKRK